MMRRWLLAATFVVGGCTPAVIAPPPASVPASGNSSETVTTPCVGEPDAPISIPWEEAVAMIENARVRAIYQSHCLEVRLDMVDGESYLTFEPALDEVFRVADGAPNGDQIIRATD
jgi:hypothetical protein